MSLSFPFLMSTRGLINTTSIHPIIYLAFGCYITKHGAPTRKHGFIRWESNITSYISRAASPHVILISPTCIEVRHTPTGRLLQIVEGKDIRLMQGFNLKEEGPMLVAMRGEKGGDGAISEKIVELVPTAPLETTGTTMGEEGLIWEEWGG